LFICRFLVLISRFDIINHATQLAGYDTNSKLAARIKFLRRVATGCSKSEYLHQVAEETDRRFHESRSPVKFMLSRAVRDKVDCNLATPL
jgi:hypothetical protein